MAILQSERGEHQHIYGAVGPNGQIKFGEGFKAQELRFGLYAIEFERPFSQTPAIVCTISGGEWQTFNKSIAILEVTTNYAICSTSSPGRPESCGFTLIAFGDL